MSALGRPARAFWNKRFSKESPQPFLPKSENQQQIDALQDQIIALTKQISEVDVPIDTAPAQASQPRQYAEEPSSTHRRTTDLSETEETWRHPMSLHPPVCPDPWLLSEGGAADCRGDEATSAQGVLVSSDGGTADCRGDGATETNTVPSPRSLASRASPDDSVQDFFSGAKQMLNTMESQLQRMSRGLRGPDSAAAPCALPTKPSLYKPAPMPVTSSTLPLQHTPTPRPPRPPIGAGLRRTGPIGAARHAPPVSKSESQAANRNLEARFRSQEKTKTSLFACLRLAIVARGLSWARRKQSPSQTMAMQWF